MLAESSDHNISHSKPSSSNDSNVNQSQTNDPSPASSSKPASKSFDIDEDDTNLYINMLADIPEQPRSQFSQSPSKSVSHDENSQKQNSYHRSSQHNTNDLPMEADDGTSIVTEAILKLKSERIGESTSEVDDEEEEEHEEMMLAMSDQEPKEVTTGEVLAAVAAAQKVRASLSTDITDNESMNNNSNNNNSDTQASVNRLDTNNAKNENLKNSSQQTQQQSQQQQQQELTYDVATAAEEAAQYVANITRNGNASDEEMEEASSATSTGTKSNTQDNNNNSINENNRSNNNPNNSNNNNNGVESKTSNSENEETSKNTLKPWPIDKPLNPKEFNKMPKALRESLVKSSETANGLTYIPLIESQMFDSKDSAFEYIKQYAHDEGFTVAESEENTQYIFTCTHSQQFAKEFGESTTDYKRSETAESSLKRKYEDDSNSNDVVYDPCPFKVAIFFSEKYGKWVLNPLFPDHNHGPTGPAASAKRRRLTYFQKTLQDDFIPPKSIIKPIPSLTYSLHSTSGGLPPNPLSLGVSRLNDHSSNADKRNAGNQKQVDLLRGLVGALRFDNAYVLDKMDNKNPSDKNASVTHLFWTTQDCMDMLQLFPEVLFINIVKSTDAPPLVHILGITCFNTTFEVGYGFIKNYLLEGLVWVLQSFKEVATKALQKDYKPTAVIIHHDLQLMGGVELVFENTCQFCVSQLMRDVNERAVAFFSTSSERKKFIEKFQKLVDSETADIYSFNEADFKKEYQGTKIFEYVTYHWLQQKTRFVRAWVDQHLHFNNYSMGKAEHAQATIAGYAQECGSDVLKLYYKISNLLKRKKSDYEKRLKEEKERCPLKFYVPFFDDVRLKVSTHALELIKEQHELYLEAMSVGEPLHRCTSMFTNTTGLPCKHTLARPVTMDDIHPHWWLYKEKHYRLPLSDYDRRALEITSKFDQTLLLAKQHFLNYTSLDLRENMLNETAKYFLRNGVTGIDSRILMTGNNGAKGGSGNSSPVMSPKIASGSVSPIHPSLGVSNGRISTPTTTQHKNSIHGINTPFQSAMSSPIVHHGMHEGVEGSPVQVSSSARRNSDYDSNPENNSHHQQAKQQHVRSNIPPADINDIASAAVAISKFKNEGSGHVGTNSSSGMSPNVVAAGADNRSHMNNGYGYIQPSIGSQQHHHSSYNRPEALPHQQQPHHLTTAIDAVTSISTTAAAASPRKCGKCNQIGHNSRTCGQRMSLDGL